MRGDTIRDKMLKTHAKDLASLIRQKEGYHNPDMRIEVIPGTGKSDHMVRVTGNESLIHTLTHEHTSYDKDIPHRKLSPTCVEFL